MVLGSGEKKAFTVRMTIGVTLAMIGFCMYSHMKLRLRPQATRLDVPASPTKAPKNIEEGQPLLPDQEQQSNTPTSLVHRN